MRYLFYLGHPAHFHLFRHVLRALEAKGYAVKVLAKRKDVLEALLERAAWPYEFVGGRARNTGRLRIGGALLGRSWRVYRLARAFRPDVMVGTSAEITYAGRLLGIPSIVVNEDDCDVVPLFAWAAYPFADVLVAPASCRMGRWQRKTVHYEGYHELAYLHPNHFTPDARIGRALRASSARYFILRFAALNAHHDRGRAGLDAAVATRVVRLLEPHGRVYITAERPLEPHLETYRLRINPLDVHSALFYAGMYVGDSQTMAAEAAVLGTPALRFNDFVGEIGYLDELEHRYGLTRGVRTDAPETLYATLQAWLSRTELEEEWQQRRMRMLREKIDVAQFLTRFIEQYPTRKARRRPWSGRKERRKPKMLQRNAEKESAKRRPVQDTSRL